MPTLAELAARATMLAEDGHAARTWLAHMSPWPSSTMETRALASDLDALERHLEERQAKLDGRWAVAEAEGRVAAHWREYNLLCQASCDMPISWAEFHRRSFPAALWAVEDEMRARANAREHHHAAERVTGEAVACRGLRYRTVAA
jgi:hypothetical protein